MFGKEKYDPCLQIVNDIDVSYEYLVAFTALDQQQ